MAEDCPEESLQVACDAKKRRRASGTAVEQERKPPEPNGEGIHNLSNFLAAYGRQSIWPSLSTPGAGYRVPSMAPDAVTATQAANNKLIKDARMTRCHDPVIQTELPGQTTPALAAFRREGLDLEELNWNQLQVIYKELEEQEIAIKKLMAVHKLQFIARCPSGTRPYQHGGISSDQPNLSLNLTGRPQPQPSLSAAPEPQLSAERALTTAVCPADKPLHAASGPQRLTQHDGVGPSMTLADMPPQGFTLTSTATPAAALAAGPYSSTCPDTSAAIAGQRNPQTVPSSPPPSPPRKRRQAVYGPRRAPSGREHSEVSDPPSAAPTTATTGISIGNGARGSQEIHHQADVAPQQLISHPNPHPQQRLRNCAREDSNLAAVIPSSRHNSQDTYGSQATPYPTTHLQPPPMPPPSERDGALPAPARSRLSIGSGGGGMDCLRPCAVATAGGPQGYSIRRPSARQWGRVQAPAAGTTTPAAAQPQLAAEVTAGGLCLGLDNGDPSQRLSGVCGLRMAPVPYHGPMPYRGTFVYRTPMPYRAPVPYRGMMPFRGPPPAPLLPLGVRHAWGWPCLPADPSREDDGEGGQGPWRGPHEAPTAAAAEQ